MTERAEHGRGGASEDYWSGLKLRLRQAVVSLALLAVVWLLLKLNLAFTGAIAGAIVLSALPPQRWQWLGTAVAWGGLALFVYFYLGGTRLAVLVAILGAIFATMALRDAKLGGRG
ncbi:MAG: hypothetical protein SFZ23_03225 [Planctomycetota bacterium]|nr:hypothetical protein [Planctomycetota bacterium]